MLYKSAHKSPDPTFLGLKIIGCGSLVSWTRLNYIGRLHLFMVLLPEPSVVNSCRFIEHSNLGVKNYPT
jgi:hypothetical protein